MRVPEVDLVRAVALCMMIVYHFLFAIRFLDMADVEVLIGFWRVFAYATASLFVAIAGVSLTLAATGLRRRGESERRVAAAQLRRGLTIFAWGLVITLVTSLALEQGAILFGILHLIGLGTILAIPLVDRPRASLVIGTLCLFLGPLAARYTGPLWLVWLGFHPSDFVSLDYVPLLPWFGVLLIGVTTGWALFPNGMPRRQLRPFPGWAAPLLWLGRHTLLIYLIHAPVILAFLLAWKSIA